MNKARVENLTDAIVGIIITIMVLEIKVPNTASLTAIISDFPYLIAYIVSFILMGDAWYNHNYMFAQIKTINRKIYWLNNLWIFWMSLIPVAAAWAGKFIDSVGPEIFFFLIFFAWSLSYAILSRAIVVQLEREKLVTGQKIKGMFVYRFFTSKWFFIAAVVNFMVIFIYPPMGMALTFLGLISDQIRINPYDER